MVIATLHVFGIRRVQLARAMAHVATDRFSLGRTSGLHFAKLLGTGSGESFTLRDADLQHWARFAVWHDAAAAAAYDRCDVWTRFAGETMRVELAPTRAHGCWSGRDPFASTRGGFEPVATEAPAGGIAVLTRARVHLRKWRAFVAATPPVAAVLNDTPGLRFSIGVGEAPIGLQGTFSLWDSNSAMEQFAYGSAPHRDVMSRTRQEQWYAEEMFARFAVRSIDGTFNGQTL